MPLLGAGWLAAHVVETWCRCWLGAGCRCWCCEVPGAGAGRARSGDTPRCKNWSCCQCRVQPRKIFGMLLLSGAYAGVIHVLLLTSCAFFFNQKGPEPNMLFSTCQAWRGSVKSLMSALTIQKGLLLEIRRLTCNTGRPATGFCCFEDKPTSFCLVHLGCAKISRLHLLSSTFFAQRSFHEEAEHVLKFITTSDRSSHS